MRLLINYFAAFLSLSVVALAATAVPCAQAANIIAFETSAPMCGSDLQCVIGNQAPAFDTIDSGVGALQPPAEHFDEDLSGMRWAGCLQGPTCAANAGMDRDNAPRTVAETLLTSYGAIATGTNFDISYASARPAQGDIGINLLPEPASIALLGSMLFGLGFICWRKLISSP